MYTTREFLIYVAHVYFGYKIRNLLELPEMEQTYERGLYLGISWWCPELNLFYHKQSTLFTFELTLRDIIYIIIIFLAHKLDTIALKILDQLRISNAKHPVFLNGHALNFVVQNRQINLDHDLYNAADAILILRCISKVLFVEMRLKLFCTKNYDCTFMQKVCQMFTLIILLIFNIMCFI